MTDLRVAGPARTRGFGPSATQRSAGPSVQTRLWLGVLPLILAGAHLLAGANRTLPSLALTCILAAGLASALLSPLRRDLSRMEGLGVLALLFSLVVATGLVSLSPFVPGGPQPLWAWAGLAPGSGTIDRSATAIELLKLAGLACVFAAGAIQGARRGRAQATLEGVVALGALHAAASLVLFGARLQPGAAERLNGGFGSANTAATVFGLIAVLSLAWILRVIRRTPDLGLTRRLPALAVPSAAVALCGAALILSASRLGFAATILASALLIVWETASHRRVGRASLVIAAVAAIGGVFMMVSAVGTPLDKLDQVGGDWRLRDQIVSVHWNAFLQAPWMGWGLGTFDAVNIQRIDAGNFDALWPVRAAHNVYLQWLEEAGLIGALPMFALIGWVIVRTTRAALGAGRGATLARGLVAADLLVLVHGLGDYALQTPSVAALWAFLLGLQFAFVRAAG